MHTINLMLITGAAVMHTTAVLMYLRAKPWKSPEGRALLLLLVVFAVIKYLLLLILIHYTREQLWLDTLVFLLMLTNGISATYFIIQVQKRNDNVPGN